MLIAHDLQVGDRIEFTDGRPVKGVWTVVQKGAKRQDGSFEPNAVIIECPLFEGQKYIAGWARAHVVGQVNGDATERR